MSEIVSPTPKYNSNLTNIIIALEKYRANFLGMNSDGKVPVQTFLQLKNLFHIIEALSSARIENNHTTLASYITARKDDQKSFSKEENFREISNLVKALDFIDKNIKDSKINKEFILELHKLVVHDLSREGDDRTGGYRIRDISIANSKHRPPLHHDVPDLMNDLIEYINKDNDDAESLIRVAIVHHQFVYIHPFSNGNGRVVRLLTYAMLCKKGFISAGVLRLFNPTAVFASDRDQYYNYLMKADKMTNEGLLEWCEYFLGGLKTEIEKSQKLADSSFVTNKILLPTISWALNREIITSLEANVLNRTVREGSIKLSSIKNLWPEDTPRLRITRFINKMRGNGFLEPDHEGAREYVIKFDNNRLTYGVLKQMEDQGMLPIRVDDFEGGTK